MLWKTDMLIMMSKLIGVKYGCKGLVACCPWGARSINISGELFDLATWYFSYFQ